MKNIPDWTPSKFVYRNGRLTASRDSSQVGISSRLVVDLVADVYDRHIERFCRGRLIDLGCGKVPLYAAYKNHVLEIVCVDWENTIHKTPYVDVECDLTKRLPFEEATFDTIILSDVLEHIPQPENLWSGMGRILATGGKLLMSVPFYYWLHEIPHDYYRYTEYALRRFAESAGFRVVVLEPFGGAPEVLADIVAKNFLQFVPVLGRALSIVVQFVTYRFIRTRFGRKLSHATRQQFPFGYFLVAERQR